MSTLADFAAVAPPTATPSFAPEAAVPLVLLGDVDAATAAVTPREVPFGDLPASVRPVQSGDLLFARLAPALQEGRLGVVPAVDAPVVFASGELINIRPHQGVPVTWLRSLLRLDRVREELALRMTGSTGRRRLPPRVLRALELPPLPDDAGLARTIAAQDAIDALEATRTLALQRLADLPATLVERAAARRSRFVLDALRPTLARGVTARGRRFVDGRPILRPTDIVDGVLDPGDLEAAADTVDPGRGDLRAGDVLVVRGHANLDRLGTAAVYRGEPERALFSAQLVRVRLPERPPLKPELLCAWMRTGEARRHVLAQARRVGGQHGLTPKQLLALPVPGLAEAEQERLASALAVLAELRALGMEQIAAVRKLRQATLAHAFRVDRRFAVGDVAAPAGDDALAGVFAALGARQQRLWQSVAQRAERFTLDDLLAAEGDRERARRGLRILERIGVAIPEREREAVSYRRFDPELDAVEDDPGSREEG